MPEFRPHYAESDSLPIGSKRFLVIYDGACEICRASVDFLRRIDCLSQYSYLTLQEYSRRPGSKIPLEMLQESIHVIDRNNGRALPGMKGISLLLRHSPPAFPIYLLVLLLRFLSIADPLYVWISSSRYLLSRRLPNH